MRKMYVNYEEGKSITAKTDFIPIMGHKGTWYVIDEQDYKGRQVFLLEHEKYGDECPCLIVDENANVIMDDVYNGFDDLDDIDNDYEASQNMPCDTYGMLACTESCSRYYKCN